MEWRLDCEELLEIAQMVKMHVLCLMGLSTFATAIHGQTDAPPTYSFRPNQRVRVSNLHLRTAQSTDPVATLTSTLETIFDDSKVCCGKNSALEDSVRSADPHSLRDVSGKVEGRHLLDDGHPIFVKGELLLPNSSKPEQLIATLLDNRPLLMQWNSHWYVVDGAVFNERVYDNGLREYFVREILILDPRFSDERTQTSFNCETSDWHQVQGLLLLSMTLQ
jgi:hypothetical protein